MSQGLFPSSGAFIFHQDLALMMVESDRCASFLQHIPPQKNVNGVKVCPLWWPIHKWKWRLTLPEPLIHRCKMPVETVPQWTRAVVKAKGGPIKHLFRSRPFMLIMPVYCCWCTYTFWCSCFLHKQNLRTWLLYWQRSHDILWILHKQKKVKSVNFRDSSWDTLDS